MHKQKLICLILCTSIVLTGCAAANTEKVVATPTTTETISAANVVTQTATQETTESAVFTNRDLDASYSEVESIAIVLNGNDISCNSGNVSVSGSTATINKEGTYLLSGTLADGSIIVDADKSEKVQLVLNGVSIYSQTTAPIYEQKVF